MATKGNLKVWMGVRKIPNPRMMYNDLWSGTVNESVATQLK